MPSPILGSLSQLHVTETHPEPFGGPSHELLHFDCRTPHTTQAVVHVVYLAFNKYPTRPRRLRPPFRLLNLISEHRAWHLFPFFREGSIP